MGFAWDSLSCVTATYPVDLGPGLDTDNEILSLSLDLAIDLPSNSRVVFDTDYSLQDWS